MKRIGGFLARLAGTAVVLAIVVVLALVAVRLLTGRGFGIWTFVSSRVRSVPDLAQAVLDSDQVSSASQGQFTNVIFLHHSTGHNLIEEGGVRERFTAAGYQFWDHGYNPTGLRNPAGEYAGYSYNVPEDNTDPDGLARIFGQQPHDLPVNTLSGLLQHEVIAFKSCFPASQITSGEQLAQYKAYYLAMRDVIDQYPNKVFIVMSPPPLNPAATDAEAAARARAFAKWLTSDEYLAGHPNVFAFDLFGHLAEDDPAAPDHNMLRATYREGTDSHPNRVANETVGPLFVDFVMEAADQYRADSATRGLGE
jgi:hypothetical protein